MVRLEDRVRALEEEQRRLAARLAALERTPTPGHASAEAAAWRSPPQPPTAWQTPPQAQPATGQPVAPRQQVDAQTLESRIGARWVAAAGGVVLLLATVFLLQLAFDRGWIGPLARIWAGIIAGIGIWVGGEMLRRRVHPPYGQVLSGTGVGLLYVTLWIAFDVDKYQAITGLSDHLGLALLCLVVAGVVAHAAVVRGAVLASTALALVHVSTFVTARYDTFSMVATALLALGVLGAAAWRRWDWLYLSGTTVFVSLFLHASAAGTEAWPLLAAAVVLTAAWVAASFLPWPRRELLPVTAALSWLGGAAATAAAVGELTVRSADAVGTALLVLAVLAAAVAFLRGPARAGHAAAALFLGAAWPLWLLDWPWPAFVWALLLAGAAVVQARRHSLFGQVTVAVLVALTTFWALVWGIGPDRDVAVAPILSYLAVIAAALGAWWGLRPTDRAVATGALVGAFVAALTAWTAFRSDPWVTLAWAATAGVALGSGALLRVRDIRLGGLAVIALLLVRIVTIDLAGADEVVRIVAFMGVGIALLGIGYVYARFLRRAPGEREEALDAAPR